MEVGLMAESSHAAPFGGATDALGNCAAQMTDRALTAPDFTNLEGRAVSAAFLRWFCAEKVTRQLKRCATDAAIPYLEGQIERRKQEIRELESRGVAERCERHAIKLTNAERWLGWLHADLEQRRAEPFVTARDVHRYIVKAETDDLLCRYCELPGMAEGKDPETGRYWFGLADHFFSYNWDSPFDDVVGAICAHSDRALAAGKPPPYYFIDNFAMIQHYKTSESEAQKKRSGDPNFTYDSPEFTWGRSTTACPECPNCPGPWDKCYNCVCTSCRKGCYDMTDWSRRREMLRDHGPDLQEALRTVRIHGFERVIQHTRSTVMLMEPPDCPRAPTRVWCLFEGNATLRYAGKLEGILSAQRQTKLMLELNSKFKELDDVVNSLNSRTADATGEEDRMKIFNAIEHDLPNGHDELDENLQTALRRWLAEAAEGVIERTDPQRKPLGKVAMAMESAEIGERWCKKLHCNLHWYAIVPMGPGLLVDTGGARLSALLEALPRLPRMVEVLGATMWSLPFLGCSAWWARVADSDSFVTIGAGVAGLGMLLCGSILHSAGEQLLVHQQQRQLRRPPFYGACTPFLIRQIGYFNDVLMFLGVGVLPFILWLTVGWQPALLGIPVGFLLQYTLWCPLGDFEAAAGDRASLCIKTAWLMLKAGDLDRAIDRFAKTQADLLRDLGPDGPESWAAAAGYARALCDAGRHEEGLAVREQVTKACWGSHPEWDLLQAGVAAAVRAPDSEVLVMLSEVTRKGFWLPAGWADSENGPSMDSNLPEWDEFLNRMVGQSEEDAHDEVPGVRQQRLQQWSLFCASRHPRRVPVQSLKPIDGVLRVDAKARVVSVEQLMSDFANCEALDEDERSFEERAGWALAGLLVDVVEIGDETHLGERGTAQVQAPYSGLGLDPGVVRAGWEAYRTAAIDLAKAHIDEFPSSGGPGNTLKRTHGLAFDEALDDLQAEEGGGYGFSPEGEAAHTLSTILKHPAWRHPAVEWCNMRCCKCGIWWQWCPRDLDEDRVGEHLEISTQEARCLHAEGKWCGPCCDGESSSTEAPQSQSTGRDARILR